MTTIDSIIIPGLTELAERMRACRAELAALRRLHRLALAAQKAEIRSRSALPDEKEGGNRDR